MTPTRDQLIDLVLRETTDKVTADGIQIAAPNILEVGCRHVRGDPKRGYENPAEAARQFAGFIADAVLALQLAYRQGSAGSHPCYDEHQPGCECIIPAQTAASTPSYLERLTAPARADAPDTGAERKRDNEPLKTDETGCVTKRFVVFNRPGMAPEKKGGWLKAEHLIAFLREAMLLDCWTPGFRATVLELTWNNDLWASSASEYLSAHDHAIGPHLARKAWKEAREKHEHIYKTPPLMPLGQEIATYHGRTAPSPQPADPDADRVRIAMQKLESIRLMRSDRPSGPYPKSYKGGFDAAADLMSGLATEALAALKSEVRP